MDSATGLQTALTTSGANGASDVIKLVQGTYTGSFYFSSNEAYDLSIEGGYTAGCGSRTVNATNTVLDGAGTDVVLVLSDQRFPVTIA